MEAFDSIRHGPMKWAAGSTVAVECTTTGPSDSSMVAPLSVGSWVGPLNDAMADMSCVFRPFSSFGSRRFHAGWLLGKTGVFPELPSLDREGNRVRAVTHSGHSMVGA